MLPSPIPSAPGIAGGPVEASRLDGVGEKKRFFSHLREIHPEVAMDVATKPP